MPRARRRRGGRALDHGRVGDPHRRLPAHAATVSGCDRAPPAASVVSLTDEAILEAWHELAREEGVFCEPASAAGLAALGAAELRARHDRRRASSPGTG